MEAIENQYTNLSQAEQALSQLEGFGSILDNLGLVYESDHNYFLIGSNPSPDDIFIYISVIEPQVKSLLEIIVPYLVNENLAFDIVKNKPIARAILNGAMGNENIGKIVRIYLPLDFNFSSITQKLVELTQNFKGPSVPNQIHVGGLIYREVGPNETVHSKKTLTSNKQQIFNGKYIVNSTLKSDVKGDVFRGYYVKNLVQFKDIVIKEGKKCMCIDESVRDIQDRLQWQRKVHEELAGTIHIPRIIDCFQEHENTYLIMEFIEGKSFRQIVRDTYGERSWLQLSKNEKIKLLNLMAEVIKTAEKIHENGYVHRDLSMANLIMNNHGKLYVIDWELAYSLNINKPTPVFTFGTPGFMSPEQQEAKKPTYKEDIYAIGTLMLVLFTNMQPLNFDLQHQDQILKGLLFFTNNFQIASTIASCLSSSAEERPVLEEIRELILSLTAHYNISAGDFETYKAINPPGKDELNELIRSALKGLTNPELVHNDSLFNMSVNISEINSNKKNPFKGCGLASPINGILILLNYTNQKNYPVEVFDYIKAYLEKYHESLLNLGDESLNGLFYGEAGKALALQHTVSIDLFQNTNKYNEKIADCFNKNANTLDLANGISGQALAAILIYCKSPSTYLKKRINLFIKTLLDSQKKNGSWPIELINKGDRDIPIGLSKGISGIVLTLMKYDELFPDEQTKSAITSGLNWLQYTYQRKNSKEDPSFISGSLGMVLVFLYAFDHLKNIELKIFAEKILYCFTDFPISSNFSIAEGLSGIGLVYIEAYKICNNPEWIKRAMWIYNVFFETIYKKQNNEITWNTNGLNEYNIGPFTGTTGIILFLIKLQQII